MHVFLSLSGGLDSAVLAVEYMERGDTVHPVFFDYGNTVVEYERGAAQQLSKFYNLVLREISLAAAGVFDDCSSALIKGGSKPVTRGYLFNNNSPETTHVPGRNLIFSAVLASIAEEFVLSGATEQALVVLGVQAQDGAIAPDCSPEFITSADSAISISTDNRVRLAAPLGRRTKKDIVARAIALGLPTELTRSCYKAQEIACGVCGACQLRRGAFAALNLTDSIQYSD